MNKFIVSVDSLSVLSEEKIKKYGIISTPLYYTLNGETKIDEFISEEEQNEFYNILRNGGRAKSSMIPPFDFIKNWTPALAQGHDILHLSISKKVSGCFDSAMNAKKELATQYPDRIIEVWDTTIAFYNVSKMAIQAAKMQTQGFRIEDVIKKLDAEKLNHNIIFTVDDIRHLHRGGRIGHVKAILGSALRLKPILYVTKKGIISHLSSVRGRKKSFDFIVNIIEKCKTEKTTWAAISHGGDEPTALRLKKALLEKYDFLKEIEIGVLNPVLGLHAGPGSFTISFYGKNREFALRH